MHKGLNVSWLTMSRNFSCTVSIFLVASEIISSIFSRMSLGLTSAMSCGFMEANRTFASTAAAEEAYSYHPIFIPVVASKEADAADRNTIHF